MKHTPTASATHDPVARISAERSHIEALLQQFDSRRQRFEPVLRALDLNPVRYLARRQHHWGLERILLAEEEFLEFLAAVRRDPTQPVMPTSAADEYWHLALLIGPLYVQICERLFRGKLLLHWPFHSLARGPVEPRMNFPDSRPETSIGHVNARS